jgi:predicted RNase H-like nuclease (RuvC/YqgF family)
MSDPSSNTPFHAIVKLEYNSQEEGEITIRVGDVVVVTNNSDDDWWEGYIEGGNPEETGFFPANYVEKKSDTVDDTVDGTIWLGLSRKLESAMKKIDSMQIDLNEQKERIEDLEGVSQRMNKKEVPEGLYLGGGRKHKRKSKNSKRCRKRTKRRKSSKCRKRR